jgi:hypothetical protein
MEFYRIEYMLKNFEEALDEEDKQYKKTQKNYEKKYQQSSPSMPNYKAPSLGNTNYGGFKTPKIDVPKITAPKFNI